jgi:hypothetical protein
MSRINEAINRIRNLECPTGDLENRVTEILLDHGVAEPNQVSVKRDNKLSTDEAQAYRVKIADEGESFIELAKSGYDDYVAKVTDAYRV